MKDLAIGADLPKTKIVEDLLGYANFAEKIAEHIIRRKDRDGLVLSINAPWGYGKTTCLNFIEEKLSIDPDIYIVKFNPWIISENKNDIILKFLYMLGNSIQKILDNQEGIAKKNLESDEISIKGFIKKCIHFIKKWWFEKDEPKTPEIRVAWKGLLGIISEKAVEEFDKIHKDLDIQKSKIEELLGKQTKRLVVFIDDLDRLTRDEVRQVFRLIKAIANFSFITYIVAFDEDVACKALESEFGNKSKDYLNKIVQIPLTLPKIYPDDLEQIFFGRLDDVISKINYNIDEEKRNRFYQINKQLIKKHIKTPRNINRFFNGFIINFIQIYNDVDLIDFLAIEMLRIFENDFYIKIRDDIDMFTGGNPLIWENETKRYFKELSDSYPEKIDLLRELFPSASKFMSGFSYASSQDDNWDKNKRICSKNRANFYFGLRLEYGAISDTEIISFLENIKSEECLDKYFNEWATTVLKNGRSLLFYWVPKLDLFSDKIYDLGLSQMFLNIIFKYKDSFRDERDADHKIFFNIDNDFRIERLKNSILKQVKNEEDRFDLINKSIKNSDNLSAIADILQTYASPYGFFGPIKDNYESIISEEHYLELEKNLLLKISKNVSNIYKYNNPIRILYFTQFRDENIYNKIMDKHLSFDDSFIQLLEKNYGKMTSSGKPGIIKYIYLGALTKYITKEKIKEKLNNISKNNDKLRVRSNKLLEDIKVAEENRYNI